MIEKLFEFIVPDPVTGCWIWQRPLQSEGYGQIRVKRRKKFVHRLMYEAFVGPIPDWLQVDHLCRERRCCNPAHLDLVTSRENTLRGVSLAAINAKKTACIHGHEFTPENTYFRKSGKRRCKECHRIRSRDYKRRKKANPAPLLDIAA